MKLKYLPLLLSCLLFISCGSERDKNAYAPEQLPPTFWVFQLDSDPAITYGFRGATAGTVSRNGSTYGNFNYRKTGDSSAVIIIQSGNVIETYDMYFTSSSAGNVTATIDDIGNKRETKKGTFRHQG